MNRLAIGLFAGCLLAASPAEISSTLVRADRAFAAGELDAALGLWTSLEGIADDPGLIAERQAAARSRLERWKEAETDYRRALGDAEIPTERRQRCLFGLGVTLIRQAGKTDRRRLREAIRIYDDLIDELPEGPMRRDSLWNLELAKLLRLSDKTPPSEEDLDNGGDSPATPKKDAPDKKDDPSKKEPTKPPDAKKTPEPKKDGIEPSEGKGPLEKTAQKSPLQKVGEVPVLKDTDDVPILTLEDTREMLKRAAMRLDKQRRSERELKAGSLEARPNDW